MPRDVLFAQDVAVIVTTYNRPLALAWVLASLSVQSVMPSQIVIADDGSGPDTRELVQTWVRYFERQHPRTLVRHVWQEDLGFRAAAARNLAVRHACEAKNIKALIFLDGDCIAPSFFLENHLMLLAPDKMVAGGRGLLSQPYTESLEELASTGSPEELLSQLGRFNSPFRLWFSKACDRYLAMQPLVHHPTLSRLRDSKPKDDGLVRTCNLSVWLTDFESVGGFDESFVDWGLEDTEFAVRLIAAGVDVRSGRFATNVFHLWHPERSRSGLQSNVGRLHYTRQVVAQSVKR